MYLNYFINKCKIEYIFRLISKWIYLFVFNYVYLFVYLFIYCQFLQEWSSITVHAKNTRIDFFFSRDVPRDRPNLQLMRKPFRFASAIMAAALFCCSSLRVETGALTTTASLLWYIFYLRWEEIKQHSSIAPLQAYLPARCLTYFAFKPMV